MPSRIRRPVHTRVVDLKDRRAALTSNQPAFDGI